MSSEAKLPRLPGRCLIVVAVVFAATATGRAQECQVNSWILNAQGHLVLRHSSDPAYYYVLYHGSAVTHIVSPVDLALGVPVEGQLAHDPGAAATAFYRVRRVPVNAPLDIDGDGIDDVWELRFRATGAALNPGDAMEDQDGSGTPDLLDYRDSLYLTAWFTSSRSYIQSYGGQVNVPIRFSQPVSGVFTYDVTGDAVAGSDYQPLTGTVSLNNSKSAAIPVHMLSSTTLAGPRSIVLTLQTPPDNVSSRIPASPAEGNDELSRYSSHVITIRDADRGLYSGNLSFLSQTTVTVSNGKTNYTVVPAPAIMPSTLRMALRSAPSPVAVIEIPECILFASRLVVPVVLSTGTPGFSSASAIQGSTTVASLGNRRVYWRFELRNFHFTEAGALFQGEARITLDGLTASGVPKTLNGTISASRIDP